MAVDSRSMATACPRQARLPVGDDVKPQVAAVDAHAGPVGTQGRTHRQAFEGGI